MLFKDSRFPLSSIKERLELPFARILHAFWIIKIYTLAQSWTTSARKEAPKQLIKGEGTDAKNNSALLRRAKRKTISNKMILSLIDIAKEKGHLDRVQMYWNTYHCQRKIIKSGSTLHGNYCKNRFCTICLVIRKAENINKYHPVLKTWEDPHFVTLTIRSVAARNLKKHIDGMLRAFDLIKMRCNKRHERGKGIKLVGLKSLECNFNALKKTYNPHFHIIVPDREIAELLKKEWMKQ